MSEIVEIKIKRLSDEFSDVPLPAYATEGSSGMDIRAAVKDELIIEPGKVALVPTNLSVEIPKGYEIQVRPRSGLAANHSIGILNSPGTIDSDYRGEVKIILMNFGDQPFAIHRGDRIAQLVVSKVYSAKIVETENLNSSIRGEGGFGHTGKK
ncbi:MAG: dUTP diphosphatase [Ignavibacterium sp.]|nr:dUTP diphosphatase [Ignavibacterium sp.]